MGNNTKTLINGMSIQTLVTIILAVIELAYFSIMSRLLSKTDFGYYATITGIMAVLSSLSEAGLGASIIQKKGADNIYISVAYTLSAILGVCFTSFLYVSAPWIAKLIADETIIIPLKVISITILLNGMNSCGNAILYKNLKFKIIGLNSIITCFISSIIGIILAYLDFGLISVITYSVLNSLITFVLLYMFYVKIPRFQINKNDARKIFSFGGWLTLSALVNNIMNQVDKLLLPRWLSIEKLGAYNRPSGFLNTMSSKINGIFDSVLFPMLSDFQDDTKKITAVFYRALELLNTFSCILALAFVFNSDLIINVFFGKDWRELSTILQILSISLVFNINNRLVDCFFRSLNYVKIGFYIRCLGLFLMLSAIYWGSRNGIVGVAIAVVTANIITILCKLLILCHKVHASKFKMLLTLICSWRASLPLFLFGLPFMFFEHNLIIEFIFAILFLIILLIEFVFFPKFVGVEYRQTVYPYIKRIKNR